MCMWPVVQYVRSHIMLVVKYCLKLVNNCVYFEALLPAFIDIIILIR